MSREETEDQLNVVMLTNMTSSSYLLAWYQQVRCHTSLTLAKTHWRLLQTLPLTTAVMTCYWWSPLTLSLSR